ncbi:MAG: hypothetical protein RBR08_13580 [Desulforegulaceae bacterium]|nr:hypothetical protein [Desulforegulaceae bacterium]
MSVQKTGCLYTPHYSCGLLPSTMRQFFILIDEKRFRKVQKSKGDRHNNHCRIFIKQVN